MTKTKCVIFAADERQPPTRWIHFHFDFRLRTQYAVVNVFVQVFDTITGHRLQAQLAQRHRHIGRRAVRSPIHKGDRKRIVLLVDGRYRARPNLDAFVLVNAAPLDAERVLVDGDDLAILQNGFELGPNGAQIDRHQQWGGHDGPQGKLGL